MTVRALRGGRSLLKRNLPLTATCTFAKTIALHAKGRIAVRVGFAGRPSLRASNAGPVYAAFADRETPSWSAARHPRTEPDAARDRKAQWRYVR